MNILGVVLSEFHHEAGKRLAASDPPQSLLTKQQFKLITDFVLPRESFCGRILAIEYLQDYYIVVCPILSENPEWDKKYKRARYYYSVSIIINRKDYLNKTMQPLYKEIVSKLGKFLRVIEETHHLIYECFENKEYTQYLFDILKQFRGEINSKGESDLTHLCSHYTFINANRPAYQLPMEQQEINCSTVPVTLLRQDEIEKVESAFGQQLLEYAYKGNYTFRRICRLHRDRERNEADIRAFYLKGAEKGILYLLDMFSLTNCYTLTQKIQEYLPQQLNHAQMAQIVKAISVKEEAVDPQELLCVYLQFNRVTPLFKIIEINRKLMAKIDIQKFIRYGQICGFLRRIHQKLIYSQFPQPLIVGEVVKRVLQERGVEFGERAVREESEKMSEMVKSSIVSGHTMDEMTVSLDVDYERVLKLLNPQGRFLLKINNN